MYLYYADIKAYEEEAKRRSAEMDKKIEEYKSRPETIMIRNWKLPEANG